MALAFILVPCACFVYEAYSLHLNAAGGQFVEREGKGLLLLRCQTRLPNLNPGLSQ